MLSLSLPVGGTKISPVRPPEVRQHEGSGRYVGAVVGMGEGIYKVSEASLALVEQDGIGVLYLKRSTSLPFSIGVPLIGLAMTDTYLS